ncbi:TraB/GumN family protein [Roseovarius aestuariivivens]|uniref:TraB/GumN family protein n=1 Tax=Roseovarius aestuariivivens TaxID=1888910 RepID=UPI001080A01E|nr:TraB/GumN family protein [Roseovarius aestuariivivens]
MRRLLTSLLLTLGLAGGALAQDPDCGGTDLIAALPEADAERLQAAVADVVHAEGLLWRARRGDTVIDIFGTYHFHHRDTDAHLARLEPLIAEADKVYLEISNADQAQMQSDMGRDPSMIFLTEGPTLIDMLGEQDWAAFAEAMEARGIPPFMAAKFKPLYATMMLGMGPCEMTSGALAAEGIDTLIGQSAAAHGTPSRSLEDFRDLMGLLDSLPMEDQLDMIRLTLAWPGETDDLSYTIRERYLREEVALIWEFSRLLSLKYGGPDAEEDFAAMSDVFLEARNRGWVERLMADTAPGERVFLAFGAGHLPDEIGMLRLLENEGFTLERLALSP